MPTPADPTPALLPAGFVARVGAAVFAPTAAARRLCRGGEGGLVDALILLPVRVLAGDGQRLTQELHDAWQEGGTAAVRGGITAVLHGISVLVPDVVLILLGGVVMGLLLGGRKRALRPGLTLDLAALAWMGWFFVLAGSSLLFTFMGRNPGPLLRQASQFLSLGVFGVIWFKALLQAHLAAESADAGKTSS